MKLQIIKSPAPGVMEIIKRRISRLRSSQEDQFRPGAIGLIQGSLVDILLAADVAEKTANVQVEEINGVCPQHITMIALLGDIAAVECALQAIREGIEQKG